MPGPLVDQPHPAAAERLQRRDHVGYRITNVVNSLATAGEEPDDVVLIVAFQDARSSAAATAS